MKKPLLGLAILCSTLMVQAETLTVEATGLKNDQGEVQFSLYNKEGSIPDKALNKYFKMQRVTISGTKAKAVFKDLPKGNYAVSLFHDENNNHKIDKGLIMPEEGVGLSNYKSVNLFNLPNFKSASFPLDHNKEVKINVIYF